MPHRLSTGDDRLQETRAVFAGHERYQVNLLSDPRLPKVPHQDHIPGPLESRRRTDEQTEVPIGEEHREQDYPEVMMTTPERNRKGALRIVRNGSSTPASSHDGADTGSEFRAMQC